MGKRTVGLLMTLVLLLVGCNSLPATVVVVVTNTPDPNVLQVTVTPAPATSAPTTANTVPATAAMDITPLGSPVPATNVAAPTTAPAGASATPNSYPTETRAQLYIAQQDFEHGYMFWISTKKAVWVLIKSKENPNVGTWKSYPDNWIEGTDPEIDASLTPGPEQYQPRRGFGKLWRTEPGLRDALGWGTTPEFALNTIYVYRPNAVQDTNGAWVLQAGKHIITSLSREQYVLSETGTWEKGG
jgi:hypothetical protein